MCRSDLLIDRGENFVLPGTTQKVPINFKIELTNQVMVWKVGDTFEERIIINKFKSWTYIIYSIQTIEKKKKWKRW